MVKKPVISGKWKVASRLRLVIFLLSLVTCHWSLLQGQQPQTSDVTGTEPSYAVNAKWTNGVAPGYMPTAGAALVLNLSAGTSFCAGAITNYAGGTLTMTNATTNYIYLNATCVPAVKTTTFVATDIPIAIVVTAGGAITTITDVRTPFIVGGGGAAGPGTVTSFSSGNLSPLFTTSVATASTTPAQSFTLSNQNANLVYGGPSSGLAAAPTFRALVGADLPVPSATTLGGVQSLGVVASKWLNTISIAGVPSATQPAFSDISGINAVAKGGTGTATGSITGTGALVYAAGGLNQNVTLTPSGTGSTFLNGQTCAGCFSSPAAQMDIGAPGAQANSLLRVGVQTVTDGFQIKNDVSNLMTYTFNSGANLEKVRITDAGSVGIGTSTITTGQALEVNGGMALNTATAEPVCSATTRGTFWVFQGAAGVTDRVDTCTKDASNAYAWRPTASTPVTAPNGGSGVVSPAIHSVLVAEGAAPFAPVPTGTAGQALISNGAGADPTFQDPIVSGPDAVGVAPTKNPVQVGCRFETTPATLTNNQVGAVHCTAAQRVIVDGSQVTQPVSAATLPLPTGAATDATIAATQGATGAAVPAQAVYMGGSDGTNQRGILTTSAANLTQAGATNAVQLNAQLATWRIVSFPAAATVATANTAAGAAGVRHVLNAFSACIATAAADTAQGPITVAIRDGTSGVGAIIGGGVISTLAAGGTACVHQSNLAVIGTAATQMTVEFAAAGAGASLESVYAQGYDVQ